MTAHGAGRCRGPRQSNEDDDDDEDDDNDNDDSDSDDNDSDDNNDINNDDGSGGGTTKHSNPTSLPGAVLRDRPIVGAHESSIDQPTVVIRPLNLRNPSRIHAMPTNTRSVPTPMRLPMQPTRVSESDCLSMRLSTRSRLRNIVTVHDLCMSHVCLTYASRAANTSEYTVVSVSECMSKYVTNKSPARPTL